MEQVFHSQSIERAVAILRALAEKNGAGARLTDVAAAAALSKSTTHRTLMALIAVGLVDHEPEKNLFFLGFELFVLGSSAANRYGLSQLTAATIAKLIEQTGDTVYLQARSGHEAICLDRREGSFPIKTLTLSVGDRRPLGIGAGSLALLAALPDAEVSRAIEANAARYATYVGFDTAVMWQMVEQTRRQGYAFNDGKIIPGMCAVGVAVLSGAGQPLASLSVAAIQNRMDPERRQSIVTWLQAGAQEVGQRLSAVTSGLTEAGVRRLIGIA